MDVIDLTSPVIEPVSLTQAKLFLRVDHEDENDLISSMISAARLKVEDYCGVSLITRSRRVRFNLLQSDSVIINHYPLSEVTAVRLTNKTGEETVLAGDQYSVNLKARPARLCLETPQNITIDQSLSVDFMAGYGTGESDIPAPFTQAILLLIAQLYERGDECPENIPLMVQALLMPYRGLRL